MPEEPDALKSGQHHANADSDRARGIRFAWSGIAILFATAGLLLVLLWGLPYETARALADRLTPDGSLEMFSQAVHARYRYLWAPGAALLAASGAAFLGRAAAVRRLRTFLVQLRADLGILLARAAGLLVEKGNLWPLLVLTGLGLIIRLALVSKPMAHDESYTVTEFAVRGLWVVLSDYHLPNNHIFHTLLVWIVANTLGILPWMVRLPALAAGVLLVPAGYLAGRALFDRPSALLGAALLGASPVLVAYSNNARGYTLLCLFALLIVGLGAFLRRHDNLAGWALLGLFSALGMYTVPIMLYPVGIVFAWLLLSWWTGDAGAARRDRRFFIALIGSACAGALATWILYLPVLIASGWESLSGNNMVAALPWDSFLGNLFARLGRTWDEWTAGFGWAGEALLAAGLALALAFHRRLTKQRFPLPLAALVWMAAVLLLQRVAPERRIWIWLLPLVLLYGSAGLVFLVRQVSQRRRSGLDAGFALLAAALVSVFAAAGALADYRAWRANPIGDVEAVTLAMTASLTPDEVVVVPPDLAPAFWYYFMRHGQSDSYLFRIKNRPFAFALVVADAAGGQSAAEAARAAGNFGDVIDLDRAQIDFSRGGLVVHRVPHR